MIKPTPEAVEIKQGTVKSVHSSVWTSVNWSNSDRNKLNEIEAQNSDVDFFEMELCNGRAVSTSYEHADAVGPPSELKEVIFE